MFPIMQEVSKKLVNYLEREPDASGPNGLDAKELCSKFTTENVVSSAFGLEANCFASSKSEFREIGRAMLNPSFFMGLKLMFAFILPGLSSILRIQYVRYQKFDRPENPNSFFLYPNPLFILTIERMKRGL